ncbi:MAG: BamA/TamA family outer membrane protein [Xanthobacteraceae bacterium]
MAVFAWRNCRSFVVRCASFALVVMPGGASAFDLFDLFARDRPPAASQEALPYAITFDAPGASSALIEALRDASTLHKLRQNSPADGGSLVQRAAGDLAPIIDTLWGAGYYGATVVIDVAGVPLTVNDVGAARATAAAEAYRARAAVPIRIKVETGPIYRLRDIRIIDAATGQPFPPAIIPPRVVKIAPGDPARAADIRAARAALVNHFRRRSHPFAKVSDTRPVVYHQLRVMDVVIALDPGPKAPFGAATVAGRTGVDPAVVRSFIYAEPGDPFSPAVIAESRKSILQLPAISSVQIRESEETDAAGGVPLIAEVTDRKLRIIGLSARYSSLDGPAMRAYWQHRNLFGGAESLRLETDLFIPPRTTSSLSDTIEHFRWSDVGGRVSATFVKPALQGTRNDLLLNARIEKDRTGGDRFGGYASNSAEASASIRHRFSSTFFTQIGFVGEVGRTSDTLGVIDYQLFGAPASVSYDSTDRLLDPTTGMRFTGSVTAYPSFLGSSVGMAEGKAQASTYYALDENARIVMAARAAIGSVAGAGLADIPANHRFYAGGGGSVRGYRYRSLSPLGPTGEVIGGRSLVETSLEARIKVSDRIGIVPFLDAGNAFLASYPDFSQPLRVAAGVGLRYYTAIGPIRVDAAFPLNPRDGDDSFAIYIGIGQAF